MYKVNNTLTSAYGPQEMDLRSKNGPVRPFGKFTIILLKFNFDYYRTCQG
jgi:hypothetical protein